MKHSPITATEGETLAKCAQCGCWVDADELPCDDPGCLLSDGGVGYARRLLAGIEQPPVGGWHCFTRCEWLKAAQEAVDGDAFDLETLIEQAGEDHGTWLPDYWRDSHYAADAGLAHGSYIPAGGSL